MGCAFGPKSHRIPVGRPPVDCPKCRGPMVVVEREGIELDWCPECPGLWFDVGEMELLAEKNGLAWSERSLSDFAPTGGPEVARPCPRCDRAMDKVWFDAGRTTLIDRCRHGLWFDRGEVGAALQSLSRERPGAAGKVVSFLGEMFRR